MRTAYSSIVRDAMDFSTAICDREGRTLAQGLTTPLHLGSFFAAMQNLLAVSGRSGGPKPGDIYIFNDPYLAAGQHLPDIYIVRPIFIGGELEGWRRRWRITTTSAALCRARTRSARPRSSRKGCGCRC